MLGGLIPPTAIGQNTRVIVNPDVSYLGVNVQEITADRAKALKLVEEAGVEVTRVEPSSPADQAGIMTGDVVTQYNGQRVEGIEQFSRLVRETPAGRDARLTVMRNGAAQTIVVKVGSRRAGVFDSGNLSLAVPFPRGGGFSIQIPDVPRSRMTWRNSTLGIEAESIDGQLAEYFGAKDGVLVRSVTRGSPAERAGIKAGDVITRVGDSRVTTAADVSNRLRSARGASTPVVLLRERKEMTVTVTISDDRASTRQRRAAVDARIY
jgi:serine protease Do